MSLTDDAMEQIGRLFKENTELRAHAEAAEQKLAALREQVATELDDIVEELKRRADGSDDPTGRTILLVQADAVSAAAERVRSQL